MLIDNEKYEKRQTLKLLAQSVRNGWPMPENSVGEALAFFAQAMNDQSLSGRDRIRAAEALSRLAADRESRMLGLAKLELDVERFEADMEKPAPVVVVEQRETFDISPETLMSSLEYLSSLGFTVEQPGDSPEADGQSGH